MVTVNEHSRRLISLALKSLDLICFSTSTALYFSHKILILYARFLLNKGFTVYMGFELYYLSLTVIDYQQKPGSSLILTIASYVYVCIILCQFQF